MILRNFKSSIKYINGIQAMFFTDEDGNDWYEIQKQLSDDTLKIMFDSSGKVVAASFDASTLAPDGFSVAEINEGNLHEDVIATGFSFSDTHSLIIPVDEWLFRNEVLMIDYVLKAENERQKLLRNINSKTSEWEKDLLLGLISEEDKERLKACRVYAKALQAMDCSTVNDKASYSAIRWPAFPEISS